MSVARYVLGQLMGPLFILLKKEKNNFTFLEKVPTKKIIIAPCVLLFQRSSPPKESELIYQGTQVHLWCLCTGIIHRYLSTSVLILLGSTKLWYVQLFKMHCTEVRPKSVQTLTTKVLIPGVTWISLISFSSSSITCFLTLMGLTFVRSCSWSSRSLVAKAPDNCTFILTQVFLKYSVSWDRIVTSKIEGYKVKKWDHKRKKNVTGKVVL